MNTITTEYLTEKLKNAPQSVLERVAGYVDALLDGETIGFVLNDQQKAILDSQKNLELKDYQEAGSVYDQVKVKYEL